MRQRRGVLLGELASAGSADPARDPEAAASLVADGLAAERGGPPGADGRLMGSRQVVVAAIIERGGRVLVSQRGPGVGHPGRWEFPGGKREPGERDVEALARELREELDVEVDIGPMVWSDQGGPAACCASSAAAGGPAQRPRALGSVQFRWVRREDLAGLELPARGPGPDRGARRRAGSDDRQPGDLVNGLHFFG